MTVSLALWLVFIVMLALLVVVRRRQDRIARERARHRAGRAAELGWTLSDQPEPGILYRLTGQSEAGIPWVVELDSRPPGDDDKPRLYWRSTAVRSRRQQAEFLLTSRLMHRMLRGRVGKALLLLESKTERQRRTRAFYTLPNTVEIDGGSPELQEKFVTQTAGGSAPPPLTPLVQNLLLQWPASASHPEAHFLLGYDETGVEIEYAGGRHEMDLIEHLVKIGANVALALAQEAGSGATSPAA